MTLSVRWPNDSTGFRSRSSHIFVYSTTSSQLHMNEHMRETVEEDDRPWDKPGQDRRDSLPHRADQLYRWSIIGVCCNLLSWLILPLTFLGVPLCVFIVIRSFLDLREMKAGTRERAGENKTA